MIARVSGRGWAPASAFLTVGKFLLFFLALQWAWGELEGTNIEKFVIHRLTVGTAVALIAQITPDVNVVGVGSRIAAPGGGINVLNGCDGTEVLFLLVSAALAYPLSWRRRAVGILAGAVYVFCLNQIRLVLLFYSYRADKSLFDQLHSFFAPLALVALALLFIVTLIQLDGPPRGRVLEA